MVAKRSAAAGAALLALSQLATSATGVEPPARVARNQTGTALTACQRITDPGSYHLTGALTGAPIAVSTEAELFGAYTGTRSLERTCLEIAASGVTLDCQGHSLTGSGETTDVAAGIFVAGTTSARLSDVTVTDCVIVDHQFGLYAGNLDGGTISAAVARSNQGTGFYLTGLSGTSVTGNTAERNDPDGILIVGGTGLTVSNNTALYNRMRGITFEGCQNCVVSANTSHSHGVIGMAIYGSQGMTLESNTAYNNRYHGFAILHEAGSATFTSNESYENDATGFYLEESTGNVLTNNVSHDNLRDGVVLFDGSTATFDGNTFRDNGGYGAFSDAPIAGGTFAGNTFSGNALGDTGSADPASIDSCAYKGGDATGWCDPVFEGGPNLKDPQATSSTSTDDAIVGARIHGDPLYYPSMGDLWMPTWADDDRVFLTWGDGTGVADGYATGHPAYQSSDEVTVTYCEKDTYAPEEDGYFPCWLWRNVFSSDYGTSQPTVALTDAGVLAFTGSVPPAAGDIANVAIDIPTGDPFFLQSQASDPIDVSPSDRNDKPGSLLFRDGRLYLSGHTPTSGYLAYSDDYGVTWTEAPNTPWGATSNFRVLMFVNMGRDYALNTDGYVYAFGVGKEAVWTPGTVYLARVPEGRIAEYGAWEYLTGVSGSVPSWSATESAATALDVLRTSGQASAMYHPGTGRYLFLTTDAGPPEHLGALYEAPAPWGPWTEAGELCFDFGCAGAGGNPLWEDGKYIAGLLPKGTGRNHVWFTISGGDYHYQLTLGKLVLGVPGCPNGEVPDDGFSDVPEGAVHEDSVDCLAWWGVASGVGGGRYAPGTSVSRAQMARFVANLLAEVGITLDTATDHFTDDAGSAHEDAINGLASAGIVAGVGDGRYAPEALVSRAQMAKFLVATYEHVAGETLAAGSDRFSDDDGSVLEPFINAAAAADLVAGTSATTYSPSGGVTRLQMATFLVNLLDLLTTEARALLPS